MKTEYNKEFLSKLKEQEIEFNADIEKLVKLHYETFDNGLFYKYLSWDTSKSYNCDYIDRENLRQTILKELEINSLKQQICQMHIEINNSGNIDELKDTLVYKFEYLTKKNKLK